MTTLPFHKSTLAAILFLAWISPALTQDCGCDVSDRKQRAFDALFDLDDDERRQAEATHLPYGVPTTPDGATNERFLHQTHYIINYDDDLRVPVWVAYRLRSSDLVFRNRTECFRRDVRLEDDDAAAFCEDYEEPIFDRGHMVPNADMTRSESAMINTYMFSNMVPQHDKFNRVIWARLERYVRNWAEEKGEIYVITGAVFDQDGNGERDADSDADLVEPRDRVAIPTHFYKIILHERANTFIESMTFLLPHLDSSPTGRTQSDHFLTDHLTTIKKIEGLTGIDFLADLRNSKERAIERFQAEEMWPRE